ncbi:MAG: flagellar motor protein MotB [Balneolaceae bacterium]|nr:flagellar motor protein MotB [Balneolaceae bacterium]
MTYADFITLMMIFFIVLYTFTPGVEKNKFEAIIGAFQGKRGVLDYDSVFSDEMLDVEMQRAKNWEQFYQYIKEQDLDDQVDVEMTPTGVRIILGESVTFDTYSAVLKPAAPPILRRIIQTIEGYEAEEIREVEIQGHTDDRPIRPAPGRLYQSNWELGAARATSVLEFLVDNSSIAAVNFKASTYSEYRPRATNDTPEGRSDNRRVELNVRYYVPQQAQSIPDSLPQEESNQADEE